MINIKEVVSQLDAATYASLEEKFRKSKGDKYLSLMKSYRANTGDEEIVEALGLNSNSFYVLKSRLYEKIQAHISSSSTTSDSKSDVLEVLRSIGKVCYSGPRHVSIAHLEKLEKDLIKQDLHHELLLVYSILKKMHVRTEKFFHYSQLYNKHTAFLLSVEKSESILGDFNLILTQYLCSKSTPLLDRLKFLHREILNHARLNSSKQIELIRNILEAEMYIFCGSDSLEIDIEETLSNARKNLEGLADFAWQKNWDVVIDYLHFEYYRSHNSTKAKQFYVQVNSHSDRLLLFSDVCPAANFFLSKAVFATKAGEDISSDAGKQFLSDPHDVYSKVILGIYRSVLSFSNNQLKEATGSLNDVMNENSFKDFFHINLEIKLTQVFYYLQMGETDLAEGLIKSVYRKIKSEELREYDHVLELIKLYNFILEDKHSAKHSDQFTLFAARNKGTHAVLQHLLPTLNSKYNPQ